MRRAVALLILVFLLVGCSGNSEFDKAMTLRDQLLKSSGCTFDTVITADYGDSLYTFAMQCKVDELGVLSFAVTEPETISGITVGISVNG